jgi:hypothetical protein
VNLQPFAAANMYQTSAAAVAEAFSKLCSSSRWSTALCSAAVAAINGSESGNYGKRAAG